jgi:hypothetical protein
VTSTKTKRQPVWAGVVVLEFFASGKLPDYLNKLPTQNVKQSFNEHVFIGAGHFWTGGGGQTTVRGLQLDGSATQLLADEKLGSAAMIKGARTATRGRNLFVVDIFESPIFARLPAGLGAVKN